MMVEISSHFVQLFLQRIVALRRASSSQVVKSESWSDGHKIKWKEEEKIERRDPSTPRPRSERKENFF